MPITFPYRIPYILIIDAFLIVWLASIETSLGQPRDRHSTTVLYDSMYLSSLPVLYPYVIVGNGREVLQYYYYYYHSTYTFSPTEE
jgi:hypothetical protein